MQVVHILDTSAMGGTETHLLTLLRHIDRLRFTPSAILSPTAREGPFSRALEEAEVPVTYHPMPRGKWDVGTLINLIRLLRRASPHIIHVHLPWTMSNRYAFVAARCAACPVVLSTEHSPSQPEIFQTGHARLIKRALVALQDTVIAVCDHVRKQLIVNANISPRKLVTIYNGIEVPGEIAIRSVNGVRQELGVGMCVPLVGMVARIDPIHKRFDDFLRAARRVSQVIPNAQFIIAGEGQPHHHLALQKHAEELGVVGRVHFLGFRDDAPRIIAALDALVLASDNEGFPLVTLEAMARETPVVATDLGGLREQISHGKTGYLVPPRDVTALAESILVLLRDPVRTREIVRQARRVVEQRFSAQGMTKATESLYLQLLGQKGVGQQQAVQFTGEM